MTARLPTLAPKEIAIEGVMVLDRVVHHDPRGFLVETMRKDDRAVDGDRFAMSYLSLTVPGESRDLDRWHVHERQTDRFVVILGEMVLALYDARATSPTRGRLAAVRLLGAPSLAEKKDTGTHLVAIPPGVYHAIRNFSEVPFLLQNYPTELYDPKDEGRVPFSQVAHVELGGTGFSWTHVQVLRP